MLNIKNITMIICILTLVAFEAYCQDPQSLETKFSSLNKTLIIEKTKLDSLNNYLNDKVKEINGEKEKKVRDNEKITQLMASSVTISSDIDNQRKKVDSIGTEIEVLKRDLTARYSSIIDSLNSLEKGTIKDVDKKEIESLIAVYTEKKLNVAPKINLLSLYPEKILEIDLSKVNNSTEKQMYRDYLQTALGEVNERLDDVEARMEETKKIITLNKKTKRFLEESEFETNIRPQNLSNGGQVASTDYNKNNGITTLSQSGLALQAESYNLLLNQLNLNTKTDANSKWNIFFDNKNPSINIEEYQKLLTLVKKRLEEYRLVLLHKLNKTK
jgi:hypothetical protein